MMRMTSIAAGLAAAAMTAGGAVALASAVDGEASSTIPQPAESAVNKDASAQYASTVPGAPPSGWSFDDMPGVAEAARRAGVDKQALGEALLELHGRWPDESWAEEAKTGERRLADALGVSVEAVRSAFSKLHDDPSSWRAGWDERTFERDLAKALGVSASDVREAFRAEQDRVADELAGRLAKQLGIDDDRARAALEALSEAHGDWSTEGWDHGSGGWDHGPGGWGHRPRGGR